MPVASRMQPRSTKTGTDSRIRLDMPSSMRPTITVSGSFVEKSRKARAPEPKQKPIGTPIARQTAITPTSSTRMLALPSWAKTGVISQSAATAAATMAMLITMSLTLVSRRNFAASATSISTMPSGMPAMRQAMEISRPGETTSLSKYVCSIAAGRRAPRKAP